jgi:hypothetical protein
MLLMILVYSLYIVLSFANKKYLENQILIFSQAGHYWFSVLRLCIYNFSIF